MSFTEEDQQWLSHVIDKAVDKNMDKLRKEIDAKVDVLRGEIRSATTDMETHLLVAFQKWASPVEIRQRG